MSVVNEAAWRWMRDAGAAGVRALLGDPGQLGAAAGRLRAALAEYGLDDEDPDDPSLAPGSQAAAEAAEADERTMRFAALAWAGLTAAERARLSALVRGLGRATDFAETLELYVDPPENDDDRGGVPAATLEDAVALAAGAHAGQVDKAGEPYLLHVLRVMLTVATPEQRMAAALHDVVEDTAATPDLLRRAGYPERVVRAVDALTKRPGEAYADAVERAAADPVARAVKLADLADNLDVRRLPAVTVDDMDRLNRYLAAWRRLRSAGARANA